MAEQYRKFRFILKSGKEFEVNISGDKVIERLALAMNTTEKIPDELAIQEGAFLIRLSNTLRILSVSHIIKMSGVIARFHVRPFCIRTGINSLHTCSIILLKLVFSKSISILLRLNLVISKNSLISSSKRSAFLKVIPTYFARVFAGMSGSSLSRVR